MWYRYREPKTHHHTHHTDRVTHTKRRYSFFALLRTVLDTPLWLVRGYLSRFHHTDLKYANGTTLWLCLLFFAMKIFTALAISLLWASGTECFSLNSRNNALTPTLKSSPIKTTPSFERKARSPNFQLKASTTPPSSSDLELDTEAIAKYGLALVTQLSLISGLFYGLDTVLASTDLSTLPTPATWLICYFFCLRSRTFNPLNNKRPTRSKNAEGEEEIDVMTDLKRPSWFPPGILFPIMWVLIIGPMRATSSTMVIESLGGYFNPALMSFMLHLSLGDVWNTINNTEKRVGTAVAGISIFYMSAFNAAYQYYQVDPFAGKLLGATTIWLTAAAAIITEIWRLNPDENGEKASLLPMKVVGEDSVTTFSWGSKKEE